MLDRVMTDIEARRLIEPLYVTQAMGPTSIAKHLTSICSYEQVMRVTAYYRKKRSDDRRKRKGGPLVRTINLAVSEAVFKALEPHAKARNLSVSRLAARLVDAGSECVDAILDDQGERA